MREWGVVFFAFGLLLFIALIIFFELKDYEPSEELKLEAEAVRYCNKQHHPVDLNYEDWLKCLKEFDQ